MRETEIREAWMKETWITEYHDRKDIADWWLALRAKELGEIRERMSRIGVHTDHNGGYCDTGDDMDWSCRSECSDNTKSQALRIVDELIEKP